MTMSLSEMRKVKTLTWLQWAMERKRKQQAAASGSKRACCNSLLLPADLANVILFIRRISSQLFDNAVVLHLRFLILITSYHHNNIMINDHQ